MYTSHPPANRLKAVAPLKLWNARATVLNVSKAQLINMRDVVYALFDYVVELDPDLILFFATGSLPYVFPLMNRLSDMKRDRFIEGSVFHMFPGLSWGGSINGLRSEEFFVQEMPPILQQATSEGCGTKILSIDTTNSGKAVNKTLKAVRTACKHADRDAVVHVIGIVHGRKATLHREGQIAIEYGNGRVAHLSHPKECILPERVKSREVMELRWKDAKDRSKFYLSYWALDDVFTEDVAALVGATSLHGNLTVNAESSAGHLRITFDNGMTTTFASTGTVGRQLSQLLSRGIEDPIWRQYDELSALSPDSVGLHANFQDVQDEVLQSFEIDEDPDALEDILSKKTLLTAAEIHALTEERQFDRLTIAKVRAARSKGIPKTLVEEASNLYFAAAEQLKYDCCHESGHAVSHYLNGDTLLSICVHDRASRASGALEGERGIVLYRYSPRECVCGGYVRDGATEDESETKFTHGCPECERYLTNVLAAFFAGGVATERLMPSSHSEIDLAFDEQAASQIVENRVLPAKQAKITSEARRIAAETVGEQSELILALRDALVDNRGFLDGADASELLARLRLPRERKPDSGE
jgi:hypothetical protein